MKRGSPGPMVLLGLVTVAALSNCASPSQAPASTTPTYSATTPVPSLALVTPPPATSARVTASPSYTSTPLPTLSAPPTPTQAPTYTPIPLPTPDPSRKKVVVANASDRIDGDVSSWDALMKSPGPDGISLREALTVANLTRGPKEITFAPNLKGAVIFQSSDPNASLPALASGDLTLDGDIDHDGQPDITLDGSKGTPNNPSAVGLMVWSSDNQINGLRLQNFADDSIVITTYSTPTDKSILGNRFTNNQIDAQRPQNGIGINLKLFDPGLSGVSIENTVIAGNVITTSDTGIFVMIAHGAAHDRIVNTTVRDNAVHVVAKDPNGGAGIQINSADSNSSWHNPSASPVIFSNDNLIQDTYVLYNRIDGARYAAIGALTANMGNCQNRISHLVVAGNAVARSAIGIHMTSSEEGQLQPTQGNRLENVVVEDNSIDGPAYGIFFGAGEKLRSEYQFGNLIGNQINQVAIRGNSITDYSDVGIEIWGARADNTKSPAQNNHVAGVNISNNILTTSRSSALDGVLLMGGVTLDERWDQYTGSATQNGIEGVNLSGNRIKGGLASIRIVGGRGPQATGNHVTALALSGNTVDQPPVQVGDELGAAGNTVEQAP